jgi:uncharacterized protein
MANGLGVVGPTAIAETHCAIVLFVGDRAYKFKKPVDMGFLDFTTREARELACHREVELNRRLAPDVYLGVADVVGPDGEVCDHLVVMDRMPDDRRLATLLGKGEAGSSCLRGIARQIAALHAAAPTSVSDPAIGQVATRDAVAGNWGDNFDAMRPFVDELLPEDEFRCVHGLATRFLAGRRRLFEDRIASGMVRDGHGDLLAEDIFCLGDGPRILDCLEFADRYRYGDVLLDVAFLAMDLERLGHPEAAEQFLAWYAEFSGETHPQSLGHHYIAYRAHVRAKVACLRYAQGDLTMATQARGLHRLVLDHLRRGRVALALVGGLPGTGKSTVASGLSDSLGWALLRSDEIRKDVAGLGHTVGARELLDEGLYRPERVAEVYREMLGRTQGLLESGVPVVLDASWTAAADRRAAAELAEATSSTLVQLRCETGMEVARARLARRPVGADASDATGEVLDALAQRTDPWPQAATIRTDVPIDRVLATARSAVAQQLDLADGHPRDDAR